VLGFAVAQHACQVTQCFLVLTALDRREIAGELEQHALLRHQFLGAPDTSRARLDILEEAADVDAQRARDLIQASRRDAVDPGFVFVRLLIGDADQLGHLLLGEAQHDASLADPQTDVAVDVERTTSATDTSCRDFAGKLIHRLF
jgi:hypothetical protein